MSVTSYENSLTTRPLSLRQLPDEIVNSITHGLGLMLSVMFGIPLLIQVTRSGQPWHMAGCWVFIVSLVAVYAASTASHAFQEPQRKRLFKILDQALIFLLIAGSYTPWALVFFQETPGWILSAAVWSVALAGFTSKVAFGYRIDRVSLWMYLLLGWMPVVGVRFIFQMIPRDGLMWMFVGGLFYTLGTIFLVMDRKQYHFHAIWHIFVMLGSGFHVYAVWSCIVA